MKAVCNNVHDGHAQQKLVTPHIQDRWQQAEKNKKQTAERETNIRNQKYNKINESKNKYWKRCFNGTITRI